LLSSKLNNYSRQHFSKNTRDAYLSSIDELVSQALGNGLDVSEGSLTGTSAQQPDGLEKQPF
jgi:hypothetical protein